ALHQFRDDRRHRPAEGAPRPVGAALEPGGLRRSADRLAKARDELAVGRWEVELLETLGRHPFHRRRLARLDRPRLTPAAKEMNDDRPLRVLPPDGLNLLAHAERRRELLDELAPHRRFERFAGLALAAREFPHAREVRS